ncbi:MAG: thioredoxin family protein [Acidimicrobiales bacterium]|jgi:hypothetical protein|nr:thioredoxin family protein [Acidimicrobiales bacterium]
MERALLVVALVAVAVLAAFVLRRRATPDAPTRGTAWTVPAQLDRRDFASPESPWLVVVFTSATCDTCRGVVDKAGPLASAAVAVQEVELQHEPGLHERYGIDAVPTLVLADGDGVVRASHVGPVSASELWSTLAAVRDADEGTAG